MGMCATFSQCTTSYHSSLTPPPPPPLVSLFVIYIHIYCVQNYLLIFRFRLIFRFCIFQFRTLSFRNLYLCLTKVIVQNTKYNKLLNDLWLFVLPSAPLDPQYIYLL